MEKNTSNKLFSFFNGPVTNKLPRTEMSIADVHRGLKSDYYKKKTEFLRSVTNPDKKRKIKTTLDYVTFAGIFSERNKESIIHYSGYACIDFDRLEKNMIEPIRTLLLTDPMFETQLLFTSPSGSGLKWVVEIDLGSFPDYEVNFRGIVGYLRSTYPEYFNLKTDYIDESGKDVSRACFLCHDPAAYINPKYLINGK